MKALSDIQLPGDRRYTDEHVWIKEDGGDYVVGISDFAQDQLGEVVFVELPSVGDHFGAGDGFGTVESMKSVNTLYMPVAGDVTAVNPDLDGTPTLVNVSCYDKAWMIRVKPDSPADVNALLTADAYRAALEK
ncbi:MAG: glycine cleavage system protein GcvH [Desulfovibrionaceae bacterium]|nr:glycine cleavage system protein GcvH [Desulfovibrionaceae bacterium]